MTKVLLALSTLTVGCSARELDAWLAWYGRDPQAAVTYAEQPHIQAELHSADVEASGESLQEAPQVDGWGKWEPILACESGGDWHINTGTYDGGLQFHPNTWRAYGGREFAEYAWQAEPWQQIEIAERVLADVGWSAWPVCSARAGYR